MRGDGLVLSVPLAAWILRRSSRFVAKTRPMRDFMLDQNVFELAPLNEDGLRRSIELPTGIAELSLQNYCACMSFGVSCFLTSEKNLLKVSGLPLLSF